MNTRTLVFLTSVLVSLFQQVHAQNSFNINDFESQRILKKADSLLHAAPVTITSQVSVRSAGGMHDYHSEGDYWWPDPENPHGAYIRKDGFTNPDNFNAHRALVIRLNHIVGALTSAYQITGKEHYAQAVLPHLRSWFINPETKMNPHLSYAQAIKGKVTGRGIGIIDTIHLVEVALAIEILDQNKQLPAVDKLELEKWFSSYNDWLQNSDFGISEKNNGNNHSTCWALQVSAFARVTNDKQTAIAMRDFFKNVLLPQQMAINGSFPKELARTKPYGYSIFNLDAMTALCQVLSTPQDNLFNYQLENGASIKIGMEYLHPYIKDKSKWPKQPDVLYWKQWPVAQPALLFNAIAFNHLEWLTTWKSLERDFQNNEVVRNMPVKHYTLWFN